MGQAVEALETVPVLAHAIERAGLEALVTSALARLIEGTRVRLTAWFGRHFGGRSLDSEKQ